MEENSFVSTTSKSSTGVSGNPSGSQAGSATHTSMNVSEIVNLSSSDLVKEIENRNSLIESIKQKTKVVVEKLQKEKNVLKQQVEQANQEKQSAARKYQEEVSSLSNELSSLKQETASLKNQIEILTNQKEELQKNQINNASVNDESAAVIAMLKNELESVREENKKILKEKQSLEQGRDTLANELKESREERSKLQDVVEKNRTEIESLKNAVAEKIANNASGNGVENGNMESMKMELDASKALNDKYRESLDKAKGFIESLRKKLDDAEAEIAKQKQENNNTAELEQLQDDIDELQEENKKLREGTHRAKEVIEAHIARNGELTKEIEILRSDHAKEIENMRAEVVKAQEVSKNEVAQLKASLDLAKMSQSKSKNNNEANDILKASLQQQLSFLTNSLNEKEKEVKVLQEKQVATEKQLVIAKQKAEQIEKLRLDAEKRADDFEREINEHKQNLANTGSKLVDAAYKNSSLALDHKKEIEEFDRLLNEERAAKAALEDKLNKIEKALKEATEREKETRLKTKQFVERMLSEKKAEIQKASAQVSKVKEEYEAKIKDIAKSHEVSLFESNSLVIRLQDELKAVEQELAGRAKMTEVEMSKIIQEKEDELQWHKQQRLLAKNETLKITKRVDAMEEMLGIVRSTILDLIPATYKVQTVGTEIENHLDNSLNLALSMRDPSYIPTKTTKSQPRGRSSSLAGMANMNEKDTIENQIKSIATSLYNYIQEALTIEQKIFTKVRKICSLAIEKRTGALCDIGQVSKIFNGAVFGSGDGSGSTPRNSDLARGGRRSSLGGGNRSMKEIQPQERVWATQKNPSSTGGVVDVNAKSAPVLERRTSFNIPGEPSIKGGVQYEQPSFGSRKSSSNNKPVELTGMASVRNAPTSGRVIDSSSL